MFPYYLSVITCSQQELVPSFVSGYLESFDDSRAQEQEKMTQSQENIISLLEHCSRVRRQGRGENGKGGGVTVGGNVNITIRDGDIRN